MADESCSRERAKMSINFKRSSSLGQFYWSKRSNLWCGLSERCAVSFTPWALSSYHLVIMGWSNQRQHLENLGTASHVMSLSIWLSRILVVARGIFDLHCVMWILSWCLWDLVPWPGIQLVVIFFQSLSHVKLFETPWTLPCQASLFFTISQSMTKLIFIESVMPSNHFTLCHPLLLLPSIFASVQVFSNETTHRIR